MPRIGLISTKAVYTLQLNLTQRDLQNSFTILSFIDLNITLHVSDRAMRVSQRFGIWLGSTSISIGLTLMAISGSALHALADDTVVVTADQARIVKIPAGAQTLVIGNPSIADVTLQNGVMIVTGKGFGETNFIALDNAGNPVAESTIRVIGASNALVVQRGMEQQSYTCAPRCQPTVKLGDDPKYMSEVAGEFQTHASQSGGK